ncbi:hypothetical protein [Microbacterium sp.]|uniref:PilW family protein n=1 Tax=Microbacterium sp. TaxID=51671 RepID=UPI002D16503B|nr:hypothetical protein [Microbacterium sp.]HWK76917.1 hypothetical protein [Microbacterium sp.]
MTRRQDPDDDGLTLVELILYMLIAGVVLVLVSSIFINGWGAQVATTDRDAATGQANLVTASLQKSIRNATEINPSTGSGDTLVAVVATGSSGWECRAWKRDATGDLLYKSSNSVIDTSVTTGWATLATGIDDGPIFSAPSSTRLEYSFTASAGSATVPINGAVKAQAVIQGAGPCW